MTFGDCFEIAARQPRMIKEPVQRRKYALKPIFSWKYVSPLGSQIFEQG
jgi:hypothetical protein